MTYCVFGNHCFLGFHGRVLWTFVSYACDDSQCWRDELGFSTFYNLLEQYFMKLFVGHYYAICKYTRWQLIAYWSECKYNCSMFIIVNSNKFIHLLICKVEIILDRFPKFIQLLIINTNAFIAWIDLYQYHINGAWSN